MNTMQLLSILKTDKITRQHNGGVFPIDKLPKKISSFPILYVINTDKSDKPGMHWVALYFNEDKRAEFFDSYGNPPDKYDAHLMRFIDRHSSGVLYNDRCLQSLDSTVCAQYCIMFAQYRCRNVAMQTTVHMFTRDTRYNDAFVHNFVESLYNVALPISDGDFIINQIVKSFQSIVNK